MSMFYVQVAVMEAGPLGELVTDTGDSLVTSPVAEVGQAIAKELAPVSKTFQSAAASAKVRHLHFVLSVVMCHCTVEKNVLIKLSQCQLEAGKVFKIYNANAIV